MTLKSQSTDSLALRWPTHKLRGCTCCLGRSTRESPTSTHSASSQHQMCAITSPVPMINYKQKPVWKGSIERTRPSWSMSTNERRRKNISKQTKDKFSRIGCRSDGLQHQPTGLNLKPLWQTPITCTRNLLILSTSRASTKRAGKEQQWLRASSKVSRAQLFEGVTHTLNLLEILRIATRNKFLFIDTDLVDGV